MDQGETNSVKVVKLELELILRRHLIKVVVQRVLLTHLLPLRVFTDLRNSVNVLIRASVGVPELRSLEYLMLPLRALLYRNLVHARNDVQIRVH